MNDPAILTLLISLFTLGVFTGLQFVSLPSIIREITEGAIILITFMLIVWCFIFGVSAAVTL